MIPIFRTLIIFLILCLISSVSSNSISLLIKSCYANFENFQNHPDIAEAKTVDDMIAWLREQLGIEIDVVNLSDYIGTWWNNDLNQIDILSVDGNSVTFRFSFYRLSGSDGEITATAYDNSLPFNEGTGKSSGTIMFNNDSITLHFIEATPYVFESYHTMDFDFCRKDSD